MSTLLAQVDLGKSFLLNPDGTTVAEKYGNPAALVNLLLPNLMIIAGLLLFFFILGAGFKMVMSPSDKKAQEEGSKRIGYAVGGFVLLFISYWIAQILERFLGVSILGGGL